MSAPSAANPVEDFRSERRRVLDGSGLETEEASDYLAGLDRLRFASVLLAAGASRPRIQPRGGFPSFDKQRALILALDSAGADFLPLTIDSFTRQNDHARAAELLEQSERDGQDLLNGYPLLAHGHLRSRGLFDGVDRPVSLRHGTPDARLLVEVALASGITEIEGGGISYTLPYSRDFPLDRALLYWQYVDRLCAASGGLEAPVHRESFGVLTATMVPPVIVIVVQLCELLLAAEQGVTSFSVSFGQTGSLEQDLAVAAVLREKSTELLDRFGFEGVRVRLAYHQWMGAFPADRDLASHAIAASSVGAALSGADKVVVKTRDEAFGIPPVDSTVDAVRATRYVLEMFPGVQAFQSERTAAEIELIRTEVDEVMEHVLEQPGGLFWQSVHRAVLDGCIDVPFSPHEQNHGRLVTVRDASRAIRIVDPGRLPLGAATVAIERRRAAAEADATAPLWERLLADVRIMG